MSLVITKKLEIKSSGRVQPKPPAIIEEINNVTAAWLFNESSGTTVYDSSGNGVNSTSDGGTSIGAGKFGNARLFSGTTSIKFGNVNLIGSGTQPFSISSWIKHPALTGGQYYMPHRLRQDTQFFTAIDTSYITLVFRGQTQWGWNGINSYLNANAWNHIVSIYNGGNKSSSSSYSIYINGVLRSGGTVTNRGTAGGLAVVDTALGSDSNGTSDIGNSPQGIDETFITTQVLSQSTVTNIYNNRVTSSGGSKVQIVSV